MINILSIFRITMSVVKNTSLLPALEATLEEEWMQSLVFSPFHKYVYFMYIVYCMFIVILQAGAYMFTIHICTHDMKKGLLSIR